MMSERISRGKINAEKVQLRNLTIELTSGLTRIKSEISKLKGEVHLSSGIISELRAENERLKKDISILWNKIRELENKR
jgi:hypothetical protein